MGYTIAVVSGKGGVGKSTVSVGLGTFLANQNHKVILIDNDAGLRTLDFMLEVSKEVVYDISDIISGNCNPEKAIYKTNCKNLSLIPASLDIKNYVSPTALKQLIAYLYKYYDFVLIDSPAGVSSGFNSAIYPSDMAIIVCNLDIISIKDAAIVIQKIKETSNIKTSLVINKYSTKSFKNLGIYKNSDDLASTVGVQHIDILPYNKKILYSAARCLNCKDKKMSLSFEKLGCEVLKLI
jgi:septum site-determining protein MinD